MKLEQNSVTFFLRIPHDVIVTVLTTWISPKALAVVDCAFCSVRERLTFLQFISDDDFQIVGYPYFFSKAYLNWLTLRSIKTKCVALAHFRKVFNTHLRCLQSFNFEFLHLLECDLMKEDFSCTFPALRKLILGTKNYKSTELLNLLNNCPRLESLHIGVCLEQLQTLVTAQDRALVGDHMGLLELHCCSVPVKDTLLYKIFEHNFGLMYLTLNDCPSISDKCFHYLPDLCKTVKYLSMSNCLTITDAGIYHLAEHCHTLQYLKLVDNRQLSQESILKLVTVSPRLRSFHVAMMTAQPYFIFTDLHQYCGHLHSVALQKFSALIDSNLEAIVLHNPGLTSMNISNCSNITDKSVLVLVRSLNSHLLSLTVSECYKLSDTAMIELAEMCPNLVSLDISYCYYIYAPAVQEVLIKCTQLQSLNILRCFNINTSCFQNLAHYCHTGKVPPPVTVLTSSASELSEPSQVSEMDSSSMVLGAPKAPAHHALSLTSLNVALCDLISSMSLNKFVEVCPGLTHLNVDNNHEMRDAILFLFTRPEISHMLKIDMQNCSDVNDELFKQIFRIYDHNRVFKASDRHCVSLYINEAAKKVIERDIYYFELEVKRSTAKELVDALNNNPDGEDDITVFTEVSFQMYVNLTEFNISGCSLLNDLSVYIIANMCGKLRAFDASGCIKIGDNSVVYLAAVCVELNVLRLDDCELVTGVAINKIKKLRPLLQVFSFANCSIANE